MFKYLEALFYFISPQHFITENFKHTAKKKKFTVNTYIHNLSSPFVQIK